ncbi:MAG TPA: conjugative transposon protein TraM [Flavobacterium sp.]|nr:conjugative transposon protein TraM [Flavobacterium sp.]
MENNKNKQEMLKNLKKVGVYIGLAIVFAFSMWLIFVPSESTKEAEQKGLNTSIPQPKDESIIGDKKSAYEQEQSKERAESKMRTLQDFEDLMGTNHQGNDDQNTAEQSQSKTANQFSVRSINREKTGVKGSIAAYRDINRTMGNFYDHPRVDLETERLKDENQRLRAQLESKNSTANVMDEQVKLMEKSYEMAAKYLPKSPNASPVDPQKAADSIQPKTSKKAIAAPVRKLKEQIVSRLEHSPIPVPEQANFITPVGVDQDAPIKNTISACVHEQLTLTSGQSVRLRLLEPVRIGNQLIPKGTLISGTAAIAGDRLSLSVSSIEYQGNITAVELIVYDTDGQPGIYIPSSMETGALKEIGAGMGQGMGTSFSITQNAGQQVASDLSKGIIQGTSAYLSKKVKQVKVHLKSGYKVFLLPKSK